MRPECVLTRKSSHSSFGSVNAYNPQFRFSCHYAQGPGARIFGFEYLSDELPSNSDDEKRMHRAERRAERKTKERRHRFEFRPPDRKESASSTSAAFSSRSGPSYFASERGQFGHLSAFCSKSSDSSKANPRHDWDMALLPGHTLSNIKQLLDGVFVISGIIKVEVALFPRINCRLLANEKTDDHVMLLEGIASFKYHLMREQDRVQGTFEHGNS
ncbi:hypothetical protein P5673_032424 [Acropora cervicornis]|uniref:Uncharacterized protein n=1 Tax=Acropora cervicornis TaxID=6130 RepID=A0AAD9PRV1_ACRCE|nr:hypothetical protein P5673_032424 [Acropora cervicornis]